MENPPDNAIGKTNKSAIKSLTAGSLSLFLYALSLPLIFSIESNAWIIIAIIVSIGGITLCIISLNAGNESLEQFKGTDNSEKGYGIAIIGRILGILGAIASVLFLILMFFGLVAQ